MTTKNILKLIIAVVICELAGVIGSLFTASSITNWYANLAKPQLTPPNWVFGPVWTTLFFLMGVALWLVWIHKSVAPKARRSAITIFFIQLTLNVFWSIIFFSLHSPRGAFIGIIFLWLAILTTIIIFSKISKLAAWLLIPYILWVSFATYLNYSIWILN